MTKGERISALEQQYRVMLEALTITVDHVMALCVIHAAAFGKLDEQARTEVREIALGTLGDQPEHARARALAETLTLEPAAAVVDHHAALSAALADVPGRLN